MKKELTKKQKGYVEARAKGIDKHKSAIMAGATIDNVPFFEKSEAVQTELARVRAEAVSNTGITKEEVAEMFMEAARMARIIGDPANLISAARELGKMLGHYAPEIKKIEKGVTSAELRKALKDMSDEELYKLAHARTIEGRSERVTEDVRQLPGPEEPKTVLPDA